MSAPPRSGTDEELLRATADGDEEAFVEVYRRYRDRVYRFALRMTGSPDAARDVTHTCFASLLESPARYDARRAGLGTYLCTAARNQSLRYASRDWRERAASAPADARPAAGPSPLDVVLREEKARMVRRALSVLPPLHREVLILSEFEELNLAVIAQIVGAEVGAVKVRLHRARRKLRRVLESHVKSGVLTVE